MTVRVGGIKASLPCWTPRSPAACGETGELRGSHERADNVDVEAVGEIAEREAGVGVRPRDLAPDTLRAEGSRAGGPAKPRPRRLVVVARHDQPQRAVCGTVEQRVDQ